MGYACYSGYPTDTEANRAHDDGPPPPSRHRRRRVPRREPYAWLSIGAMSLGLGAALALGSGVANADTGGSAASSSQSEGPSGGASPGSHSGKPAKTARSNPERTHGSSAAKSARNSTNPASRTSVRNPSAASATTATAPTIAAPELDPEGGTNASVERANGHPTVVAPEHVAPAEAPAAATVRAQAQPAGAVQAALTAFGLAPSGPSTPTVNPLVGLLWGASRKTESASAARRTTGVSIVAAASTPSVSIADASIAEGNSGTSNMAFVVSLSSASTSTVTVRYATSNGTASSSSDYTSTSGTLTFAPGVTSQTVTVKVRGDTTVEPDETFTVTLSRPSGATIARKTATGTIVNDDASTPTVSIASSSAAEGNTGTSNLAFTVSLSKASTSTITVNYATSNGTATAGQDYNTTSGTITFAPGTTSQVVNVGVIGDTTVESAETFSVTLSAPSGATIAGTAATGTILNDDATSGGPAVPFGSHLRPYAAGTITPTGSQATMDAAVVSLYNTWKANFLVSAGNYGLAVKSVDADYPYVAEAQGYGLELTALMAGADPTAQASFDGILKYVLAHPSSINSGLLAAEQNSSFVSVDGSDSATDGDLAIAYGLLLADKQWGSTGTYNYKQLAVSRINAIKASEMDPNTKLPTLGDWNTPGDSLYNSTRPSDFMIDHFRAFKVATNDPFWDQAVTATQNLVTQQQNTYAPATGLIADFVVNTNTTPKPAPANFLEAKTDGQYSYNAVRVPWHIGTDAVVYGDATSKAQAQKITAWFRTKTGDDPSKVVSGYKLDGTPVVSYLDPEFVAVLGPAAMGNSANQAWLDKIWTYTVAQSKTSAMNDYYAASLTLQCMIVMSGNYWAP